MKLPELERRLRGSADGEAWVEHVAAYFGSHPLHYGHGTDNAADEAYWLVRASHGWEGDAWRRADAQLVPRVLELARRRVEERRPLGYLLGEAWFAGLRFIVDERVLIPRSPIAELIERCYAPWCELEPGDRVLDIGTGSGCLAIATALHCAGVRVEATEVSAAAWSIASANIAALAADVVLIDADLYPVGREPYRLIVSNPPYVPTAELADLPAEYSHEPGFALDGGPTGLDVVERILAGAVEHLAPGGVLIVEVGGSQDAFTAAHPHLPVTWLEFERGGDGVLLATREELTGHLES